MTHHVVESNEWIIDSDDFDFAGLQGGPQYQTTNTAESTKKKTRDLQVMCWSTVGNLDGNWYGHLHGSVWNQKSPSRLSNSPIDTNPWLAHDYCFKMATARQKRNLWNKIKELVKSKGHWTSSIWTLQLLDQYSTRMFWSHTCYLI